MEREEGRCPALSVASRNKLRVGWVGLSALLALTPVHAEANRRLDLRENWALQSSCKAGTPGECLAARRIGGMQ